MTIFVKGGLINFTMEEFEFTPLAYNELATNFCLLKNNVRKFKILFRFI